MKHEFIKFTPIDVPTASIILPDRYKEMFSNMDSLKSFIVQRLVHEAEGVIRTSVYTQLKDIDFYES